MNTKLEITENIPTPDDMQFLEDRLYEHNAAKTGHDDGELFSFFIRNEQQEIVAGLVGWTWAHACEVKTLWVHSAYRGQGYGHSLLQAAEEKAHAAGCQVILISSYSFQAPGFYQKHGYELGWKLEDFPPGHQHCYLVKRLAQPEQQQ